MSVTESRLTVRPWEKQHYADGTIGIVSWDTDGSVEVITTHVWDTGIGAEAKASLIEAAPELLEVLEAILRQASAWIDPFTLKAARKAIAKAEGQS